MADRKRDLLIDFNQLPGAKKYWGWFLALGILLTVLGVLAIGYAQWATEFTVILLGILLIGGGIVQIINGLYSSRWRGYAVSLVLGVLYIIAGILCVFRPMQSATGIGLLIAIMFLLAGIFRLVAALKHRFDNRGWVAFNGVISIVLGLLLLAGWPQDAMWVIGLFVGIDLIFMGVYWIALSIAAGRSR